MSFDHTFDAAFREYVLIGIFQIVKYNKLPSVHLFYDTIIHYNVRIISVTHCYPIAFAAQTSGRNSNYQLLTFT